MKTWLWMAALAAAGCQLKTTGLLNGKGPLGGRNNEPAIGGGGGGGESGDSGDSGDSATVDDGRLDDGRGGDLKEAIVVVEAVPGAPTIGPTRPTWCDTLAADHVHGVGINWAATYMKQIVEGKNVWSNSTNFLQIACLTPDGAKVQEQTGHFVQYWANRTGLDAAGLADLFDYMVDEERYESERKAACATLAVDAEASPREAALGKAALTVYACNVSEPGDSGSGNIGWHLDRGARTPELARAYEVLICLNPHAGEPGKLAAYSVCGADARRLDEKALEKEIAEAPAWAQTTARVSHGIARMRAADFERVARAAAKKDEAWQKLLFDIPEQTWTSWEKAYKANQKAFDAATAFSDAIDEGRTKKLKGCWKQAWSNLRDFVDARKPESRQALDAVLEDPIGHVILGHAAMCAQVEGDVGGKWLAMVWSSYRVGRGPRMAIGYALADAVVQIQEDRPRFSVEPIAPRYWSMSSLGDSSGEPVEGDKGAVIKSLDRDGDRVTVTFKKETATRRECSKWGPERVSRVREDGSLEYAAPCLERNKLVTDDVTHEPVTVYADFAGALAKGQYVRFAGSADDALPVEIYASKDGKKLVGYLGFALQ